MRGWLRDALFWARVFVLSLREQVLGISCVGCGDSARLPAPAGWRFTTMAGEEPRWVCGECSREGAEPAQW